MVKPISKRLLDDLFNEYKSSIQYWASEQSTAYEKVIEQIKEDIKKDVLSAIRQLELPDGTNIEDFYITRTYSNSAKVSFEISFSCIQTEALLQALEAKQIECEKFRHKYRELQVWKTNCIKAGEILPFDVPDVPQEVIYANGIRCS